MEMLLVEDDVYCVDFFKRALSKGNKAIRLHHMGSAEEAKDFLAAKQDPRDICLIVLDIKLPRRSGFELLQFIKGSETTRTIPVVMFTSSAERQDIDRSYQLGANSYLVKPIDYLEFSAAIQQLEVYWLRTNRL